GYAPRATWILTPQPPPSRPLPLERFQLAVEGEAQNQLLEAQARPEGERARAQPADRPRRDLEDEGAALVDAQLGVDRPLGEAQRRAGITGHGGDALLRRRRQARRRGVDRLLEERTGERVRLVEECQRVEAAADQQALQRDFAAGADIFDEQRPARADRRRRVRLRQDGRDAPE